MDDQYPEWLIRGIPNCSFVQNGLLTHEAFQFDENESRKDGFSELSVNWMDDDNAMSFTLKQRNERKDKPAFPGGVAKLELEKIKMILACHIEASHFAYERQRLSNNPYHGNLLLLKGLPKCLKIQVTNGLALVAGTNIYLSEEEKTDLTD